MVTIVNSMLYVWVFSFSIVKNKRASGFVSSGNSRGQGEAEEDSLKQAGPRFRYSARPPAGLAALSPHPAWRRRSAPVTVTVFLMLCPRPAAAGLHSSPQVHSVWCLLPYVGPPYSFIMPPEMSLNYIMFTIHKT